MKAGEKIILKGNCENKKLTCTLHKITSIFSKQMFTNIVAAIFLEIFTQTVDCNKFHFTLPVTKFDFVVFFRGSTEFHS